MAPIQLDIGDPVPLAQRVQAGTYDDCLLFCTKWKIDPTLALKLFQVAAALPFPISIISGYRTEASQRELLARPDTTAAPVHLSTHTSCPATGADVRVDLPTVTDAHKRAFGAAAERVGLRWGGGARRENGIPAGSEWAHVDLGPRQGS